MPFLKRLFRFTSRTRAEIDADVKDEIAFHLEMRARELAARGWSLDAARAEARRQFGDLAETATYCRTLDEDKEMRMRLRLRADDLRQDLTYGARTMFRQPGLSLVGILTIALGIGATTLVFSVVYASLLAPLPFPHPARLMVVRVSLPDYADLRESVGAFESSGVYGSNLYTIDDEDEQVLGSVASPGIFTTLGVTPLLGRAIEERDGVAPVVVLGNGLWKRRFGADPQVVGRTIRLSGRAHTIIGVMPERFLLESRAYQLWTNIDAAMVAVPQQTRNRSLRIFRAIGRLKPDVTAQQAQAELSALATRLEATHPSTNAGVALTLASVHERLVGDARTALLVALG